MGKKSLLFYIFKLIADLLHGVGTDFIVIFLIMAAPLVEKLIVFLNILRCPEIAANLTFFSFLNFSLDIFGFFT